MTDSVKRILRTFVVSFVGIALPGVLGFMHDVTAWANSNGQAAFPDAHNLTYLGVSALSAGMIAALNALLIVGENATGKGLLRDVPPKPAAPEATP